MFGWSGGELLIVLFLVLLLFGGAKLPSLARGLGQASLDKAKHIAIQVEDLEARGSTEVLVNELPVRATDGHAQRRRSRRLRTLPGLKRRILPRFRLRRSRADGGRGGGCHATKYIDPA